MAVYLNSTCLGIWNLCFALSLQHTELSSTLFFANIMLLFWVFNKIFRRASGISESEVNGFVILILGIVVFGVKQWISGFSAINTTSMYTGHSMLGVLFAVCGSIAAAVFFIKNYEVTYYLPSYTCLLLMTLFTIGNLEAINFGLGIFYPTTHSIKPLIFSSSIQSNKHGLWSKNHSPISFGQYLEVQ